MMLKVVNYHQLQKLQQLSLLEECRENGNPIKSEVELALDKGEKGAIKVAAEVLVCLADPP